MVSVNGDAAVELAETKWGANPVASGAVITSGFITRSVSTRLNVSARDSVIVSIAGHTVSNYSEMDNGTIIARFFRS
jgi:hypothetical protein